MGAEQQRPFDGLITVIVPTRARPALVRRALASLSALNDDRHEILVVENQRVSELGPLAGGNVSVVHEPTPGLSFARNRGIKEARGDVVAFVDDDCEVSPEWLTELRAAFSGDDVACVTGRVMPASTARISQRWFERLATFDRGTDPARFVHNGSPRPVTPADGARLGSGCNMAFRKSLFDRIGMFDLALDTPFIRGCGDLEMFARVLEAGEVTVYAPAAQIRHHHRERLLPLATQLFGYGVGLGAVSLKYVVDGRASWRQMLRYQRETITWLLDASTRHGGGSRLVGAPLIAAQLIGDLVGPFAYLFLRWRNYRTHSV